MLANRKFLLCCATVLALVIGSSTAVAKTHARHTAHVSGLVVSINAQRHTLKLLVKHAVRHHKAVARTASANGASTMLVAFDHATVTGPNGAVAVGDQVTVTTTQAVGATTVASAIDVIGQPNGGDAGKGAAVPGDVTAVDPANGTLTLAVRSTDPQGLSQDGSVMVTLGASTILAVGDTNGDGHITLADVAVGDHVVVFTTDATANPIVAVGLMDASHVGGDHRTQSGDGSHHEFTPIAGSVATLDPAGSSLTLTVSEGALAGHTITVDLGPHVSYGGEDSGHDGPMSLADVAVGDSVVVYTRDATTTPVVAVGVVDKAKAAAGTSSGDGEQQTSGSTSTSSGETVHFTGVVSAVRMDGLTVTVGEGPLSGQSVVVAVPSSASLDGATGANGGPESLTNVAVGDTVTVFTHSTTGSPVVAVGVRDSGNSASAAD